MQKSHGQHQEDGDSGQMLQEADEEEEMHLQPNTCIGQMCQGCWYPGQNFSVLCVSSSCLNSTGTKDTHNALMLTYSLHTWSTETADTY